MNVNAVLAPRMASYATSLRQSHAQGADQDGADSKDALAHHGVEPGAMLHLSAAAAQMLGEPAVEDQAPVDRKHERAQDDESKSKRLEQEERAEKASEDAFKRELAQSDAHVRGHEQAHVAAAGGLAVGGVHYHYQVGPDGQRYAIGGHVAIDTSTEATPEATIAKMRRVRAAALAPADPSAADVQVAQRASVKEAEARQEIVAREREEQEEKLEAAKARQGAIPDALELYRFGDLSADSPTPGQVLKTVA